MEHGLTRGNNPIMPIFALKANHNYNDKPEQFGSSVVVQIVGADQIKE
jgi:hypothetical protein